MLQKRALLALITLAIPLGLGGVAKGQVIPWVLPWNDSTPGATDFSSFNSPIGTNRVRVDAEGHFSVDERRIRFWGVNFAGDSPFMPTNNAEAVAARLAKFGINSVRLHHMDPSWAYNGGLIAYTSSSSTNFNPVNLERLHWLVSRLKAHGVYSDVNLLVGREYRSGDGLGPEVTGMDWKDAHILGYFFEPALALQEDYATKLLTPTNRFSGLPLAQDPAVAFVEIINENGIIEKWLEGGLDRLPTRYALSLQTRWNAWLAARYTNDTAMLSAWHIISRPLGPNLIPNGSFSNGLTGWVAEQHNAAQAGFSRTYDFANGGPSAKIVVTNADTAGWYIQFNYPYVRVISNQVYSVSFWAKSSPATNADVSVMQAHETWSNLGFSRTLGLTPNWQFFTNSFQAAASDTNARLNFGSMGDKRATFWFADVRLQPGGQIGVLPPGASLAAGTVPNLAHSDPGYTGTSEARRDWLKFLRELESGYFDAMAAHLRSHIGYAGLIIGTIMANSPATVQSRLDVIDAHAYWQHPQFPGQPWDPVNWNQPNISLINSLGDDNTLAGLARQRIQGKPFTVTEYQHPSPNYYGAEGPVLLAAYGALQDWDGMWLFDYGQGNDVVPMGYIRGFFNIDQHPGKMANVLLAANLFRRVDVQNASQQFTMALTPDHELDLLQNASAWSLFNSSQLGVPRQFAFTSRLSTSVGTDAVGLTNPPAAPSGNVLTSDTGQLRWDLSQPNRGLVTVDTTRTKAVLGFADNRAVTLGGITFQSKTTRLGWSTLGLTLTRGEVLTNDCSAIIVATGWTENNGQVWSNTNKTSVGNQWGQAPVLTEVVPFTLTLPVGTNHVRVWALDERGQHRAALPVSGDASSTTISATTNSASIWYELRVERWIAGFDLWRARYFSAAELLDPGISSEAAAPDGDGVANLWKYYLGLPGKTPAPAERLPSAGLMSLNRQRYLSLTFGRDKMATDILCAGEISSDRLTWHSGTGYAVFEPGVDLGVLERVTVRDFLPIDSFSTRYLRLSLQRTTGRLAAD